MDWLGSLTLIVFVASLLMFCSELADGNHLTTLLIYGFLSILSIAAFIVRESRYEKPLLDLSIFKNKLFTLAIVSMNIIKMLKNLFNQNNLLLVESNERITFFSYINLTYNDIGSNSNLNSFNFIITIS